MDAKCLIYSKWKIYTKRKSQPCTSSNFAITCCLKYSWYVFWQMFPCPVFGVSCAQQKMEAHIKDDFGNFVLPLDYKELHKTKILLHQRDKCGIMQFTERDGGSKSSKHSAANV